ncbi:hypothetical protein EDC04DRAFT_781599 [Pisolithus marmoratus]|nr:hypothetical protein EDC04DRAFT_781599 [Pisolithus marmoratus]
MRPPVWTSVSVQEGGPAPERSVRNDVNEVVVQPVQILQPPEPQSALSTLAVAREPSIATSEEAQVGHTVGNECDTDTVFLFLVIGCALDTFHSVQTSESASGTATPKAGTDERRLGECEPSEACRDKYTGSVSLHSTFSDDDEGSDVDEDSAGKDKQHSDSGEAACSVEQCRSAVPEVLEPQISPPVSFDDLADLYYFEDEDDEDAINRGYGFSLELVGSSNRPGSYLGIPGPARFPPVVRVSCYRPASPAWPPCQCSSTDQECADDQESQSPIIDKAGMDVGPLSDSVRASVWGRVCQETLNAVIVVAEAEAETEHQLLQLDSNSKTASSPKDDTARHPDDDASHVRDLRSVSSDNPTMLTILEEKERGESHDCESPRKDTDIELDVILRELRYSPIRYTL